MASVIQTLGPSAYGGFMELVGDGEDACTHKALVRFHGSDRALDSYVKVYCTKTAPKGFVNELIGYTLAKWGGLNVAHRAAVLLLDPAQASYLPPHMQPMLTTSGQVVSWCVQSIGGRTPLQLYRFNTDRAAALKAVRHDFKKWKDLPDVAALDAWLLNEDRNLGNLVRLGAGRYALIDHGRVCTGNSWNSPLDRLRMKHFNKLAKIAWDEDDLDLAPSEFHTPLVGSFERHEQALDEAANDLEYWLPKLISSAEEADATQFLAERVTAVRDHLKATYGVLFP